MRTLTGTLLIALAAVGCHKDDVDVATLNTNPLDADWTGGARMVIDSVYTEELILGSVYQQVIELHVNGQNFPSGTEYEIWMVETTVPDTVVLYSVLDTDLQHVMENHLVALGTEYCFTFDLVVGGTVLEHHDLCDTANL